MCNLVDVGVSWIGDRSQALPREIVQVSPVEFNEAHRYLPPSTSRFPGPISYDSFPYWTEIINSADVRSPVREGYVKKGVQTAFSTALESILLYAAAHLRTIPVMYVTADAQIAESRIERNFFPMFQDSGFGDIFQSTDIGNMRKTGKTKKLLQWVGGGFLLPQGANNADKMRDVSILLLLLDEIDAWPNTRNDGDPVQLIKDRTSAFDQIRKIFVGTTPLKKGSSRIDSLHARGDQRVYLLRCLKCGYPQPLRWSGENKETGKKYGFKWDFTGQGSLDLESVRFHCKNCDHAHMEYDKPKLIKEDNAFWKPTAVPVEPNIRSWHIPAMLSPYGVQPWSKCVSRWLDAIDKDTGKVKDVEKLQVFYNNVLGESFQDLGGGKVRFEAVSAHRRPFYRKNEIPNSHIEQACGSGVLYLTCTVDVHKSNLAVAVWGWTSDRTCWLIDYMRIEDNSEEGCELIESPAWGVLAKLIEEKTWIADDGKQYRITLTLIDSGWSSSTVVDFAAGYESMVYPILGRTQTAMPRNIKEFSEFTTTAGTIGYLVHSDHYKDRIAPVLRRDWRPDEGKQSAYTFNAPVDTRDAELKELTREYRRSKKVTTGTGEVFYWHRPGNAPNELWDLMVYGHASVEILAWMTCVKHFGLEVVDDFQFRELCKDGMFYSDL